jgi:hypothetical protein
MVSNVPKMLTMTRTVIFMRLLRLSCEKSARGTSCSVDRLAGLFLEDGGGFGLLVWRAWRGDVADEKRAAAVVPCVGFENEVLECGEGIMLRGLENSGGLGRPTRRTAARILYRGCRESNSRV